MNDLRRRFRRRFALISTVVTAVAALGLAYLIANTFWSMLVDFGEKRHQEFAGQFYALALEREGAFLAESRKLGAAAADRPEAKRLEALAQQFFRSHKVVRFAIHDRDGITLYSTNRKEIGTRLADLRGLEAARLGDTTSSAESASGFPDLNGIAAERRVLRTATPVAAGARTAIVSIYTDATNYRSIIQGSLYTIYTAVALVLFAVLGMLIFFVGKDRALAEQNERNLALSETARLAEEASRLKSRFVASMGHELRTPLNAIIGFSEAMKARTFGPIGSPKYEDYAATIHASGLHLLAVVNDILDMARIEGGKAVVHESVFSLRAALANCAQVIGVEAMRKGHAFAADIPESLPSCRGDEAKIKQIVLNLLANAVRYTARGGKICLAVCERGDGSVAISVTDTGIGIPADQIAGIFVPFRQVENAKVRRSGGLGLGLSIAKSFADIHGADLAVESEPGKGTVARLVLPAARLVPQPLGALAAAA